ncbi:hypothetical protein [Halomonas cerina]|uniref:Sulfotransferase family protein n=1 Tax=Halomonas cerina TaxID=447424 RepID=A0A839VIJ6_9GAMM|nr:hypothetical protein [Halomonas cerina]MBB3192206.1 hypothetical protein [Halomonas cerina]
MQHIDKILASYIKCPSSFWEGNERQASKSSERICKLRSYYGLGEESLSKIIIAIAKERINEELPTIYVSSFGSSGSHLLQHVLVDSLGFIGLGEIYLPPKIERLLKDGEDATNKLFVESYHLLHSGPERIFAKKEIINTAHKAKLQGFSSNTATYSSAFLLRNPVDLVMSRTFRKGEYRNYLGKEGVSDKEYLKENLVKTKRFYDAALSYPYDQYFFYEDLLSCDYEVSVSIAKFAKRFNSKDAIHEALKKAVSNGASNKYKGPDITIDDAYYSIAKSELVSVLGEFHKIREEYRAMST